MNETPGKVPDPAEAQSRPRGPYGWPARPPRAHRRDRAGPFPRPVDVAAIEEQASLPPASAVPQPPEYAAAHGADPADLAKVEAFARDHGLTVKDPAPPTARSSLRPVRGIRRGLRRRVGPLRNGPRHVPCPPGPIVMPADLRPIIEAVVGLDNQPHARPHEG